MRTEPEEMKRVSRVKTVVSNVTCQVSDLRLAVTAGAVCRAGQEKRR